MFLRLYAILWYFIYPEKYIYKQPHYIIIKNKYSKNKKKNIYKLYENLNIFNAFQN